MRKGHGLSVHRADCEHVARGRQNAPQRWMSLAWQSDSAEEARFFVPLDLEITDDRATLASVATELSSAGSAIVGVNVEPNKEGKDSLNLMIQVRSRLHLMHIMRARSNVFPPCLMWRDVSTATRGYSFRRKIGKCDEGSRGSPLCCS